MKRYLLFLTLMLSGMTVAWALGHSADNATCATPIIDSVPINNLPTLFVNAHGNIKENRLASAKLLGWVGAPYSQNICGGYFAEPFIPGSAKVLPPLKTTPVTIGADSGALQYTGISTLSGNIVVTQPGRVVTADQANITSNQGQLLSANLQDNVMLREAGKIAVAKKAYLNLQGKSYSLEDVIYRLFLGNPTQKNSTLSAPLSAWGRASSALYPPSGITVLRNVSYSTCPPESRAWLLQATQINLNHDSGRGTATNAVFYANGLPIFYTPYFNFPIDNRRQTGFLYPQFSFGNTSGFGLGTPYYWNIMDNMDDTITPYFYTKRGLLLNNIFRYLTPSSNGVLNFSILPDDREFRDFQDDEAAILPANSPGLNDLLDENSVRNFVSFTDHSQFTPNLSASINYTRVSDDYYVQNIGNVLQAAQNQLLQQGQVIYNADTWSFLGNMQSFQTLHPVNEPIVQNQYSMLPQLLFTSNLPYHINQLNYQWQAEYVNFVEAPNPDIPGPTPPSGQRINLIPGINCPLSNEYGYLTPSLLYEFTQYNLGDQPMGFPDEITRALPIISIDSGLYLERNTRLFNKDYEQTLEPRLFYLFVPYHNQDDIPVFDSSLQPFNFNQLFSLNRFTGNDRIGDANQISFALTTRFLDQATGDQKFSAGVGIIKYFENRKVTLCNTPDCIDSPYSVGTTSPTESVSPIVGFAQYNVGPNWNVAMDAAWDPSNAQTQNANITFQYIPLPNHLVNLGYNYVRFGDLFALPSNFNPLIVPPNQLNNEYNLSQPTASLAWPLTDRWSILGSFSYSLNQNHALTYFSGVQYNSCCWAIQLVFARAFNGFNTIGVPQYNTGIYMQWAFKGLAKVAANDPTALLLTNIPGYQNNFGMI
jgi:LPS-assembly protein